MAMEDDKGPGAASSRRGQRETLLISDAALQTPELPLWALYSCDTPIPGGCVKQQTYPNEFCELQPLRPAGLVERFRSQLSQGTQLCSELVIISVDFSEW